MLADLDELVVLAEIWCEVHLFLEVQVQVLKDKVQAPLRVYNVV